MKLDRRKLRIVKATRKQLYSITVMTRAFFPYTGFTMDAIEKRLKDRSITYWVALYRGHTVGFVDYKETPKSVKLMGLAVLEEFRGNGLGGKLLRKAVALSDKKRKDMVLLVAEDNSGALKLYEKQGFSKKGRLAKRLWDKDVWMYVRPAKDKKTRAS